MRRLAPKEPRACVDWVSYEWKTRMSDFVCIWRGLEVNQMPSFVPTLIYTRYTHLFPAYTERGHFWTLPVNDAFCMFCNSNIKMFITECWQGSLFPCVVNGVTSSHAGNAHSVISEAKFSLEPPTVTSRCYVKIAWWCEYYRMCKELQTLDVISVVV